MNGKTKYIKPNNLWYILAGCFLFLYGCEFDKNETESPHLISIPQGFPEMTFPDDNPLTLSSWELGKLLFYDSSFSIDGSKNCASCHKAHLAFSDNLATSPGAFERDGVRNAPSLANIGYHPYYLREGGISTLEIQALVPIQEQNEFAHNIVDLAAELKENELYNRLAKQAYNRELDPFVITRALGVFQRTIVSGNSAFDKYHFQNKKDALSDLEISGMNLFFSDRLACGKCHGGFNFTLYGFENNGLYEEYDDEGRMHLTNENIDKAKFKVPSLRNIELTAPYMHDGSLATLEHVIDHYNSGGKSHPNKSELIQPLNLTTVEKEALIAFLKSLTDHEFVENQIYKNE